MVEVKEMEGETKADGELGLDWRLDPEGGGAGGKFQHPDLIRDNFP